MCRHIRATRVEPFAGKCRGRHLNNRSAFLAFDPPLCGGTGFPLHPAWAQYPAIMPSHTAFFGIKERRSMAVLLMAAVGLMAAYWVAWFTHRSLVASETSVPYLQFEEAFPLADAWLALSMTAAAFCLVTFRRVA